MKKYQLKNFDVLLDAEFDTEAEAEGYARYLLKHSPIVAEKWNSIYKIVVAEFHPKKEQTQCPVCGIKIVAPASLPVKELSTKGSQLSSDLSSNASPVEREQTETRPTGTPPVVSGDIGNTPATHGKLPISGDKACICKKVLIGGRLVNSHQQWEKCPIHQGQQKNHAPEISGPSNPTTESWEEQWDAQFAVTSEGRVYMEPASKHKAFIHQLLTEEKRKK